jgi:hypothetical protein
MIDDVITARSGKWYSKMKRITSFDREKSETLQVDEISHLQYQDQAEAIADSFSAISKEYDPVKKDNIKVPSFQKSSIPQFKPHKIRKYLENIKTNKSTAPGDIPAKIIKEFALFGVQSFLNNGVQPSLIPLLLSYFEEREMRVKWHGKLSQLRKLPGVEL